MGYYKIIRVNADGSESLLAKTQSYGKASYLKAMAHKRPRNKGLKIYTTHTSPKK